jgi:ABC-2 type transport system permease protein
VSWLAILSALIRRDWGIQRSYRFQLIGYITGTSADLFLFFFIGNFVDQTGLTSVPGLEYGYFSFVFVGLVLSRLTRAVLGAFQRSLQQDQARGTLEAMLASPRSPAALIASNPLYDLLQTLVTQIIMIILAVILLDFRVVFDPIATPGAALALVTCVIVYASIGLSLAGITLVVKQGGSSITTLLFTSIMFLGAIYYPVEVLPRPLQIIARCLPFTWAVETLRAALFTGDLLIGRLALLIIAAILAAPSSVWFFNKSLDRARREGTLSQY